MRKVIYGLLSIGALCMALVSCKKQNDTTTQPLATASTEQIVTSNQFNGTYVVKYIGNASTGAWQSATTVGNNFMPGRFTYRIDKLEFHPEFGSIRISSLVPNFSGQVQEKYFFDADYTVSGDNLKTVGVQSFAKGFKGNFRVNSLSGNQLILTDIRTSTSWIFMK